jgi:hypothetical protein
MPRRGTEYDFERPLRGRHVAIPGVSRLPLAHVSSVHAGRRIVETSKLTTRWCEVFGRDLTYFFVLKPAYLGKFDSEKSDYLDYFPVAFILRPEAVPAPHHIYPFDTGAAASGAFKSRANRLIPLEDYELEGTHEAAAGFVGWAFGKPSAYYDGILRPSVQAEARPAESVVTGYIAIAKLGVSGDPAHDTRASTLEVASADNVDTTGNVLLAILPKQLLKVTGRFIDALRTLIAGGTEVETYDWRPNRAPAEFQRDVLRISRAWYASKGIEV